MTAHKYAAMIKAKADNMDLVVFGNAIGGEWRECTFADLTIATGFYEFFLCLPKHKKAVLNTLNGGESQVNYGERWSEANCGVSVIWGKSWWYMSEGCESRIKPRKEKRWVAVNSGKGLACKNLFESKQDAVEAVCLDMDWQLIEIEVEV